jgi:hypothetical protein
MNNEFDLIAPSPQAAVMECVNHCRTTRRECSKYIKEGMATAYPSVNGIEWKFDGGREGLCFARGVMEG